MAEEKKCKSCGSPHVVLECAKCGESFCGNCIILGMRGKTYCIPCYEQREAVKRALR